VRFSGGQKGLRGPLADEGRSPARPASATAVTGATDATVSNLGHSHDCGIAIDARIAVPLEFCRWNFAPWFRDARHLMERDALIATDSRPGGSNPRARVLPAAPKPKNLRQGIAGGFGGLALSRLCLLQT